MEKRAIGFLNGNENLLFTDLLGDPDIKHYYDDTDILYSLNLNTTFSNIWRGLSINKKITASERTGQLNNLIDQNEYLNTYVSTSYFALENGRKKVKEPRAEEIYLYKGLQGIATFALDGNLNEEQQLLAKEYSLITESAQNDIKKREMQLVFNFSPNDTIIGGLSTNFIEEKGMTPEKLANIKLFRKSEKEKREARSKDVAKLTIEEYPEVFEMEINRKALSDFIGKGSARTLNKERYVKEQTIKMDKEKQRTFSLWREGKSRITNEALLRNPLKFEEIKLNNPSKPIVDNDELEERWKKLLSYYYVPTNASSQFEAHNRIHNEIAYEKWVVYENKRKPVRSKAKSNGGSGGLNLGVVIEHISRNFQYNDEKHISVLLGWQPRVKKSDEYYSLYCELKDKYSEQTGSPIYTLLTEFDRLVNQTKLTDMEKDIVDFLLVRNVKHRSGIIIDNPYLEIAIYLNNTYATDLEVRDVKRKVDQIAKKIANTYLELVDRSPVVECTCCGESRKQHERNFGKDKRNNSGFKSVCRECEKEKRKQYAN